MSVRGVANRVSFILRNQGRETSNPAIVFPGFKNTSTFSYGFWVKQLNNIPAIVSIHSGTNGGQFNIGNDGVNWHLSARSEAVNFSTVYFAPVTMDRWAYIGIVKNGPFFSIFYGLQDPLSTNPWERPVIIAGTHTLNYDIDFDFDYFMLLTGTSNAIAGFKFWDIALPTAELQAQAHTWNAEATPGMNPFWASTLRTPGDLSNIAHPRTGPDWSANFAYTLITPLSGLEYGDDPAYMANTSPCPTWVYPYPPNVFTHSTVNPGLSPTLPTVYNAPEFWSFDDRGSISPTDHQLNFMEYYAYPLSNGAGYAHSDSWPLWKDENGVLVESARTSADRFETDTGVPMPAAAKLSNVYLWKFGGQFTYQPRVPQGPTANANIYDLMLYVVYTGYPTGQPALPAQDLTGLFAIKKGPPFLDRYNRGVELKIPQPTVRTAYIGE